MRLVFRLRAPDIAEEMALRDDLSGVAGKRAQEGKLGGSELELLAIQDRFVAEPLFAKTGRGYLKSEGVSTIGKIKANLRRKAAKTK